MKAETENNLRMFIDMDSTIPREDVQHFIDILNGKISDAKDLGIIRYKKLMKLTGLCHLSVNRYIRLGFFEAAYVPGRTLAVGITLESYNRFLHDHHEDNWKGKRK